MTDSQSSRLSRPDAGVELVDAIKGMRADGERLPIVVYSAFLEDRNVKAALPGVDAFVSKAAPAAKFIETIQRVITESHARRLTPQGPATLAQIRTVIREEIERFAPVRERTLQVPGQGAFELIKPLIGYKRDIEEQLSRFPYEQNVFLMMKFRSSNRDLAVRAMITAWIKQVRAK